ncbi:MAG: hypothetical protein AAGM38_10885 [Pseudomonadota bacterium]
MNGDKRLKAAARVAAERKAAAVSGMNFSIRDLRTAADWLNNEGVRYCHPDDQAALSRAAEYLRFVADQREEYEATRQEPDPRMDRLKSALERVWSARAQRNAQRRAI